MEQSASKLSENPSIKGWDSVPSAVLPLALQLACRIFLHKICCPQVPKLLYISLHPFNFNFRFVNIKKTTKFVGLCTDDIRVKAAAPQYDLHPVSLDQTAELISTVHLPPCLGRWKS